MTRGHKLIEELGSGGFGVVWRARMSGGVDVALKMLSDPKDPESVARFRQEIRCLSKLDHPHVVKILRVGLTDISPFFVMSLYGGSLASIITGFQANHARIPKVFGAVLAGVQYAHEQGVLHRDLKPENILVNNDDDVVVSDFGLGRVIDSASTRCTRTGDSMGTLYFSAPELLTNAKSADRRSDIYSLGCILCELYGGSVMSLHYLGALPPAIAQVVRRATRPDPADRFSEVREMRTAYEIAAGLAAAGAGTSTLEALLASVVASGEADDQQMAELAQRLSEIINDPDALHSALMQLPGSVLAALAKDHPEVTENLVKAFCQHLTSQGWPFGYTDQIADKCAEFFGDLTDSDLRSLFLPALLELGVGHNRWHVMGVFGSLLEAAADDLEAQRFSEALQARQDLLKDVKDYVSRARLCGALRDLFAGIS